MSTRLTLSAPLDIAAEDNARNEPEPDITVSRLSFREYAGNPGPSDAKLVVEVADESIKQDLGVKASLYARAGIPEYWVLDVQRRVLHVHRDPREGEYRERLELRDGDCVAPLAEPEGLITVACLLP